MYNDDHKNRVFREKSESSDLQLCQRDFMGDAGFHRRR